MSSIEKALKISLQAHTNQKDKAGKPYILHPLRLMNKMDTEDEMIVALLHDVVEDSEWTFEMIAAEGFSKKIIDALILLTHNDYEEYTEYINKIKNNKLALKVKLADLEDNMDLKRISEPKQKDFERLLKYQKYYKILKDIG